MSHDNSTLLILLKDKLKKGLYVEIENIIKTNSKLLENEKILFIYGLSLLQVKKFSAAQIIFEKIISLNERNIEAYFQLGLCLRAQKKFDQAINLLSRSIKIENNKIILLLLSNLYRDLGDFTNASIIINSCIRLFPNFDEAKLLLANIYTDQGKFDEAKKSIDEQIKKNDHEALISYIYILMEEGNYSLAINEIEKIPHLRDSNPRLEYFLSIILLSRFQFEKGWGHYEARFKLNRSNLSRQVMNAITRPRWDRKQPYKKILIWGEQGIGDQIIFSNFIDVIDGKFEKIILCVTEKLIPFFQAIYPSMEVNSIKNIPQIKDFDFHIPISSLGLYFQEEISKKKILNKNLFSNLKYNQLAIKNLKKIPPKIKKIRIGLSWISNSGITKNKKSIKLKLFEDFFSLNDVEFINLQYTDEYKDITQLENEINRKIFIDHDIDCFDNILELAILMQSCDLIITVSNSNAHIAGKIGVKTFILLPHHAGPLWYWHNNNQEGQNFWYSSIKTFHQDKNLEWKGAINKAKEELTTFISNRNKI